MTILWLFLIFAGSAMIIYPLLSRNSGSDTSA
jgi:hypothetical protein